MSLTPLNIEPDKANIASTRYWKGRRGLPVDAAAPFAIDEPSWTV